MLSTEQLWRLVIAIRVQPTHHVVAFDPTGLQPNGRMLIEVDGLRIYQHRWLYMQLIGKLTKRDYLLLSCGVMGCQNPYHFEKSRSPVRPLPRAERGKNLRRAPATARENAAKTHCPQNHEYTPENTYLWTDKRGYVHRKCRTCALRRAEQQRERNS